ncbi:MAG: hypothetical protein ABI905_16260, partial [Betaproteobacteria bacterium]
MKIIRLLILSVALFAQCSAAVFAGEGSATTGVAKALVAPPDFLFKVYPETGYAGQPRTLFFTAQLNFCAGYKFNIDTALMQSQNTVVLRTTLNPLPCPSVPLVLLYRTEFQFTPLKAGPIVVRWDQGGADIVIQTLASRVASKFDVNGMWFDSATNGSGISIHHRRATSDVAFGTWFLFGNTGDARWYAFQSANWQQDGSVLEGLLIAVEGSCARTDLVACPATGAVSPGQLPASAGPPPVLARITFQSPTRARAEVFTLNGAPVFSSELSRLA